MTAIRSEAFVPLTTVASASGRNDQTSFSVTILPQTAAVQNFKPLAIESPSNSPAAPLHHGKSCDPRVSIQREGDHVTGIRIQCSCGQVIDLACAY
jgi:hypothetical protein